MENKARLTSIPALDSVRVTEDWPGSWLAEYLDAQGRWNTFSRKFPSRKLAYEAAHTCWLRERCP